MDENKTVSDYVDDPLAFFIYNKVDCMRDCDIIQICKDFYEETEVIESKNLIFEISHFDQIFNILLNQEKNSFKITILYTFL